MIGFGLVHSNIAMIRGGTTGYCFEGKDRGYISTVQIQRLLNDIAEWARLQEAWQGGMRQRKRVTFVDVQGI
jgi:hypothetical protein